MVTCHGKNDRVVRPHLVHRFLGLMMTRPGHAFERWGSNVFFVGSKFVFNLVWAFFSINNLRTSVKTLLYRNLRYKNTYEIVSRYTVEPRYSTFQETGWNYALY